jgi:multidrug efflux pump subunit AcrA (membrane-fusion protein)
VEGFIIVNPDAQGIAVPAESVVSFAGVERVFLAQSDTLDDRVVRVGRRLADGRLEIVEGLNEGDPVVAKALDRMAKGQKVRVR